MLRHPCILRGDRRQVRAAKSDEDRNKGEKIRNGCLTPAFSGAQKRAVMLHHPAFSGIPNAKKGKQNKKGSRTKGNKIKNGLLTTAFSGAKKKAEMSLPSTKGATQQSVD